MQSEIQAVIDQLISDVRIAWGIPTAAKVHLNDVQLPQDTVPYAILNLSQVTPDPDTRTPVTEEISLEFSITGKFKKTDSGTVYDFQAGKLFPLRKTLQDNPNYAGSYAPYVTRLGFETPQEELEEGLVSIQLDFTCMITAGRTDL
jgi:hypothetical protein